MARERFSGGGAEFQMVELPQTGHVAIGTHRIPSGTKAAGYAALIAAFQLKVPAPDELVAISDRHTLRREGVWRVLTPRYAPEDTLAGHLEFALRHEGVDLGVLNAVFAVAPFGIVGAQRRRGGMNSTRRAPYRSAATWPAQRAPRAARKCTREADR